MYDGYLSVFDVVRDMRCTKTDHAKPWLTIFCTSPAIFLTLAGHSNLDKLFQRLCPPRKHFCCIVCWTCVRVKNFSSHSKYAIISITMASTKVRSAAKTRNSIFSVLETASAKRQQKDADQTRNRSAKNG